MERVLYPHLATYWSNLQAVLDDYSVSNAQVKADGHKVYGAILVSLSLATVGGETSSLLGGQESSIFLLTSLICRWQWSDS